MPEQIVTTSTSPKTLGLNDFWKGLLVAALTTPITILISSLEAGSFDINWKAIAIGAITGLGAYLLKNLGSAPQTTITPPPGAAAGSTVTVQIPAPGKKITQTVDVP